ncbi:hypothetical protein MTR67_020507 [Solanum verrucosum]|uniref:Uncharacterized protein n=1 Tax=Solanum verrucosum TaxID=315347 RepID=A0AAF0QQS1_SOLVR|nr:hypothetical protein MTR67_020507 [Solanum verrucosum]
MNIVESFVEFLGVVLLRFLDDLIHVSGCNIGLNLSYIEGINDSKCSGKEPLEFRDEKMEKKSRQTPGYGVGSRASQRPQKGSLNVHPWGTTPASAPQSARDASSPHSFPTFSYLFPSNVPMFLS